MSPNDPPQEYKNASFEGLDRTFSWSCCSRAKLCFPPAASFLLSDKLAPLLFFNLAPKNGLQISGKGCQKSKWDIKILGSAEINEKPALRSGSELFILVRPRLN
jgi:hypothetical protein